MRRIWILYTVLVGLLIAVPAFAAGKDFKYFIDQVVGVIGALVPLVIGLATVAFLWGVAQYILSAGDSAKKSGGKEIMYWGVIALAVMLGVWGLVEIVRDTFDLNDTNLPTPRAGF